jgi:hypothetical protein
MMPPRISRVAPVYITAFVGLISTPLAFAEPGTVLVRPREIQLSEPPSDVSRHTIVISHRGSDPMNVLTVTPTEAAIAKPVERSAGRLLGSRRAKADKGRRAR